jgi:hypothetical protein
VDVVVVDDDDVVVEEKLVDIDVDNDILPHVDIVLHHIEYDWQYVMPHQP